MSDIFKHHQKFDVCRKCGKKYIVEYTQYPSKVDDKREGYYICPYCKTDESIVRVHLLGNEDIKSIPI